MHGLEARWCQEVGPQGAGFRRHSAQRMKRCVKGRQTSTFLPQLQPLALTGTYLLKHNAKRRQFYGWMISGCWGCVVQLCWCVGKCAVQPL